MERYNFLKVEKKWQAIESATSVINNKSKKKYYCLEMFPYPSGKIHMGHVRNYTIGDVIARYKFMNDFNVLHPMGWDAFGLPAENASKLNNLHPKKWTNKNIATMKRQLKMLGLSINWNLEISTCDKEYYKHQQELFIDFYNKGLISRKETYVNWDPVEKTVLANEQVINGRGWRSNSLVERKKLSQWFFNITNFSDELLNDLESLQGWPEKVKLMQKNWIGKSFGCEINFEIKNSEDKIKVFTTRPDTIFGASFIALSTDHIISKKFINSKEFVQFKKECNKTGTTEEALANAEKIGFNSGLSVIHPFIKDKLLPIYFANFVLMDYGSGAIFGCPAHDQRDFEFAKKYDLKILKVVSDKSKDDKEILKEAYTGDGKIINSDFLNGLDVRSAKEKIINGVGLIAIAGLAIFSKSIALYTAGMGLAALLALSKITLAAFFSPIGLFAMAALGAYLVHDDAKTFAKEQYEKDGKKPLSLIRGYIAGSLGGMAEGIDQFFIDVMKVFGVERKKVDYKNLLNDSFKEMADNVVNFFTEDIPNTFMRMINSIKRFFVGSTQEDVEGDIEFRKEQIEKTQRKIELETT